MDTLSCLGGILNLAMQLYAFAYFTFFNCIYCFCLSSVVVYFLLCPFNVHIFDLLGPVKVLRQINSTLCTDEVNFQRNVSFVCEYS